MRSEVLNPIPRKCTHAVVMSVLLATAAMASLLLPRAQAQSGTEAAGDPGAARLIEMLQHRPELLAQLKAASGAAPEAISDEAVFQRIERDPGFRATLSREFEARSSVLPARPSSAPASDDPNQPAAGARPNPYPDLPSLKDLYRQVPTPAPVLKRFGADIFVNGTGNLDHLPMDLPAGPDYVLGPGDGLELNLWGSVAQRFSRVVDREGRVALPEAGSVVVAGLSLAEAQALIEKNLSAQFRDARVDVSLSRLRTVRVYVVGDVERPGAYDISSLSTPLNALYSAGGPTARGSLRTVRHYRGRQLVREVDLYDLLLAGVRADVERLQPGDTILVPPVGPQVAVAGMVRRPAVYELRGSTALSDLLDVAGGTLVSATLRQVAVERIEAHQRRVTLAVTLPNDAQELATALRGFTVQDGDRVTIAPILPYSQQTVYLEGHVFRPGKYPYRPGMEISELLGGYQDLLPEPAEHAEIVRLVPPDYRPETIEVRLSEVLGGEDPIALQPFDTVRVFGRYEVDAPKVFIYGEVLRPGEYPLSSGMKTSELVRMAGGFKRSAFTQVADVATHVVERGEKVVTQHKEVEIGSAMAGDSIVDAALKPGDILTIRQLAGWKDIGASVKVNGEVQFPGTYGIEEGERLSTLLRQAGGFRSRAYPEGAVLERTQVRELEEKTRQELIRRVEITSAAPKLPASAASAQEASTALLARAQQQQQILTALRTQPAAGRLVIRISSDIERWERTAADIELRAGDVITIPKKPNFVLVSGQVYNPAALSFAPGKKAGWYLRQAGGPTSLANKKDIYVIRANGAVLGRASTGAGWWKGNVLDATLHPGDTVVVPEKILSGSTLWTNLLTTAQMTTNIAIAAKVATSF
jgi:protein involved in polysaccharide export with SLBB domain